MKTKSLSVFLTLLLALPLLAAEPPLIRNPLSTNSAVTVPLNLEVPQWNGTAWDFVTIPPQTNITHNQVVDFNTAALAAIPGVVTNVNQFPPGTAFVFNGDSLTSGTAGNGNTSFATKFCQKYLAPFGIPFTNIAVGGTYISDATNQYSAHGCATMFPGYTNRIYVFGSGVNNININDSSATIQALLTGAINQAKADGYKVCVNELSNFGYFPAGGTQLAIQDSVNKWIDVQTNSDFVFQWVALLGKTTSTDPDSPWLIDAIHPTESVNSILGGSFNATIHGWSPRFYVRPPLVAVSGATNGVTGWKVLGTSTINTNTLTVSGAGTNIVNGTYTFQGVLLDVPTYYGYTNNANNTQLVFSRDTPDAQFCPFGAYSTKYYLATTGPVGDVTARPFVTSIAPAPVPTLTYGGTPAGTNTGVLNLSLTAFGTNLLISLSSTNGYFIYSVSGGNTNAFFVLTNTPGATVKGNISPNGSYFTNLPAGTIIQTNFVLNTTYSNAIGRPVILRGLATVTPASVAGTASLDIMIDQSGGSTFVRLGGTRLTTLIGSLVMPSDVEFGAHIATGARYYLTNSSTGTGNSTAIVSGTGQLTPLSKP